MRYTEFLNEQMLLEISIGKAAVFAAKYHSGQHRKGTGEPYIKHPVGTYRILRKLNVKDREVLVTAFLHDTIEDTQITYNDLKTEFNKNIADMVKDVTSDTKKIAVMGKPNYLADKMINMSDNALTIKLADRLHNLDDINTSSPDFAEKMYNQTTFILDRLVYKRSLKPIHKKLIRLINKQLSTYK